MALRRSRERSRLTIRSSIWVQRVRRGALLWLPGGRAAGESGRSQRRAANVTPLARRRRSREEKRRLATDVATAETRSPAATRAPRASMKQRAVVPGAEVERHAVFDEQRRRFCGCALACFPARSPHLRRVSSSAGARVEHCDGRMVEGCARGSRALDCRRVRCMEAPSISAAVIPSASPTPGLLVGADEAPLVCARDARTHAGLAEQGHP